mgnify:CR=1 FL=1
MILPGFMSSVATTNVTVNVSANGSGTADLSTLSDGSITALLAVTDDVSNTATGASDTATIQRTREALTDALA